MKMYEASPGTWIPEGQTLATMYPGDAMLDQITQICGVDFNCPTCGFDTCSCDYGDGDLANGPIVRYLGTQDTWVTKERKRIKVTEMTFEHVINTIKMLERCKSTAVATYPTLLMEATKRGLDIGEK